VNDTLISAMKAWIVTKRGSRLGNMVGCFLPDIIHELVGYDDMAGLSQRLRIDISQQFPNVNFIKVEMSLQLDSKFVDVIVSISFSTALTDIAEFQLILPTSIESHN